MLCYESDLSAGALGTAESRISNDVKFPKTDSVVC